APERSQRLPSLCSPQGQFDQFSTDIRIPNNQSGHTNRQLKPPWTCAAGIQKKNSFSLFDVRLVRMAADDNANFRWWWIQLHVVNVMKHVNGNASCPHDLDLRNSFRPGIYVVIPANRHNARQSAQAVQDLRGADITRVKNQTDATKHLQHFRA